MDKTTHIATVLFLVCVFFGVADSFVPSSIPSRTVHVSSLSWQRNSRSVLRVAAGIDPSSDVTSDDDDFPNAIGVSNALFPERLNIIYDSKCSVCRWEVDFLRSRMEDLAERRGTVGMDLFRFTDLESSDGYDEDDPRNGGVSYEDGMRMFMAVRPDGSKLHGVQVFREAYAIADLGWVFALTRTPLIGKMADAAYKVFARFRTDLTRGAPVDDIIKNYYAHEKVLGDNKGGECVPCKEKSLFD